MLRRVRKRGVAVGEGLARPLALIGLLGLLAASPAAATFVNPGFETGDLTGWTAMGQAGVQTAVVGAGSYAAYIGTVDFDHDDVNDLTGQPSTESWHWIQQSFMLPRRNSTFDVWFNVFTWDFGPPRDRDDPGFVIEINGAPVFTLNASDLSPTDDGDLDSSGWMHISWTPTGCAAPPDPTCEVVDLRVMVRNTHDRREQTWAYVDDGPPVPEPATWVLLGSGLLAGAAWLRLRG